MPSEEGERISMPPMVRRHAERLRRLSFCEQLDELIDEARRGAAELSTDTSLSHRDRARATMLFADALLDADAAELATPLFEDAMQRYRPYLQEPVMLAEVHLTNAKLEYEQLRSDRSRTSIDKAIAIATREPELGRVRARALRYRAHRGMCRGELALAERDLAAALDALRPDDLEAKIFQLECLSAHAQSIVVQRRMEEAVVCSQRALAFATRELAHEADVVAQAHQRAKILHDTCDYIRRSPAPPP